MSLLAFERRWAEALFTAILDAPLSRADVLWSRFDTAAAPLTRFGLRFMVWALVFSPLLRFERPFFAMGADARARFLTHVEARGSYFARQSLMTLKMLACFALYEDDAVRGSAS